jgi:hypothetical protein
MTSLRTLYVVVLLTAPTVCAQSLRHVWLGTGYTEGYGLRFDGLGDVDGDGASDVIVGTPYTPELGLGYQVLGKTQVYSGATGAPLWSWIGSVLGDLRRLFRSDRCIRKQYTLLPAVLLSLWLWLGIDPRS